MEEVNVTATESLPFITYDEMHEYHDTKEEAEIRLCHYHSYPNKWREIYRKSHEEVPDIYHLTSSMQDLFNEEILGRARKGAIRRSKKRPHLKGHGRRSDNEDEQDSISPSDASSIEANSASESESHYHHQHNRGQSRPHGGRRNKYPRNSYSSSRNRSSYKRAPAPAPDPEAPCPVHCKGISKEDCSHTWYQCSLNPRGPNYQRHMSRNDAHYNYNDVDQQQRTATARGNIRQSNAASAGGSGYNDRHYLDMFGLDTIVNLTDRRMKIDAETKLRTTFHSPNEAHTLIHSPNEAHTLIHSPNEAHTHPLAQRGTHSYSRPK